MMRTSDHKTAVDWGLIDFGGDGGSALAGGRRLERLGGLLVDRPLRDSPVNGTAAIVFELMSDS